MKKSAVALLWFLGANLAAADPLSVATITRPTKEMLDARVTVVGYYIFHAEEDMIYGEPQREGAFVGLTFEKLFADVPANGSYEARKTRFERFSGKQVVITGVLRVGPFGFSQYAQVYLEVEEITEANKPVQSNSVDAPRKSGAVTAISRLPRSV